MSETTAQTDVQETTQNGAVADAGAQTAPPAGEGTGEPDDGSQSPDGSKGSREARYRTERNAAREELATAHGRIEAYQRAEVERLAAEHLAVPADFWLSENAVADYVDPETGAVDADRVAEDVRLLIEERPRLGSRSPAFDPSRGMGGGTPPAKVASWSSAFRRSE